MSDIHETLLNNFDEARDMGMGTNEAMTWAKEKTHGYVDKKETKMRISDRVEVLQNNVAELQQQLAEANIRIAELIAENKNKQEALLDVSRILKGGATNMKKKKRDPSWKWLRELGHKIVLAKKGKREYTRKVKHKKEIG